MQCTGIGCCGGVERWRVRRRPEALQPCGLAAWPPRNVGRRRLGWRAASLRSPPLLARACACACRHLEHPSRYHRPLYSRLRSETHDTRLAAPATSYHNTPPPPLPPPPPLTPAPSHRLARPARAPNVIASATQRPPPTPTPTPSIVHAWPARDCLGIAL